jgi:hypothetical protein
MSTYLIAIYRVQAEKFIDHFTYDVLNGLSSAEEIIE